MKIRILLFTLLFSNFTYAQIIQMNWPKFAGKTYDFVLFQGDKPITIQQDTIPKDGKFSLIIPVQYAPYKGMCRWLITGTEQGGGLEIALDGKDFSISCDSDKPNLENIIFSEYNPMKALNSYSAEQQIFLDKWETMNKASLLYGKTHSLYSTFQNEMKIQNQEFEKFHQKLKAKSSYIERFIPILNLSKGISNKLFTDEKETAKHYVNYFVYEMNINDLYTSGFWSQVISSWVQIHCFVLNDDNLFKEQFIALTKNINNKAIYTDLVGKITYYIKQYGKDDKIELLAPLVTKSGKVTEYLGTMEVYVKATNGSQGKDLIIIEHKGKVEDHNHKTTVLKANELATGKFNQTLLVFYQSGCGSCEQMMQELLGVYEALKTKGIRVITISADEGETNYNNASKHYPWPDKYCDFQGIRGENFMNYGVKGTPTLILLDKSGKIIKTAANLKELY